MAALTLGIIGGIAPESTIEYYRTIIALHRERTGGQYPPILINSIDLKKMLALVAEQRFPELITYLVAEIRKLAAGGATIGLFASNTPHIVFDELRSQSPIPLVSIVEATFRAAEKARFRRLALFGTRFTMQADFYRSFFEPRGIAVISPNAVEQDFIHTKYMDELVNAKFLDSTRNAMLDIAERMRHDSHIEGVILGGTELPLLLRETSGRAIRLLDTGRIHAESAVEQLLA